MSRTLFINEQEIQMELTTDYGKRNAIPFTRMYVWKKVVDVFLLFSHSTNVRIRRFYSFHTQLINDDKNCKPDGQLKLVLYLQ